MRFTSEYLQIEMDSSRNNVYAAVLTISSPKAREPEMSLVLLDWIDGNVLYFPPNVNDEQIDGYLKLGRRAPRPDKKKWLKYASIIKSRFIDYSVGVHYVKQNQSAGSDTEDKNLSQLKKQQAEKNGKKYISY